MDKLAFRLLASQRNKKSSGGFTLLELIVAAAISSIVLIIGGGALAYINQNNKVAKSEIDRRAELNRALDFMADEIRQAQPTSSVTPIATNASTNLSTVAPNFSSTNKTPVLRLNIPGASQPVIYYVAAKVSGTPWFGPNIVYRWGPTMNSSGAYTDLSTPSTWQDKPLVDSIVSASTSPSCPSGWTLNPPSGSVTGFYACVDSTGKIASLNLRGRQTDAYSNTLTPYEVSSKAFARPELTAVASSSPSTPSFTLGNGTVTINQGSTATFQVLGGDIRCSGGSAIPTRATIKATGKSDTVINNTNPASPPAAVDLGTLSAGTTVTVEAQIIPGSSQNSCGLATTSRSSANSLNQLGSWVYALKNGEDAPNRPAYGGGTSMDAILGPYIDTSTRKIKGLADNQVIYLFELYSNDPNDGNVYDLQDMVVLATIAPSN